MKNLRTIRGSSGVGSLWRTLAAGAFAVAATVTAAPPAHADTINCSIIEVEASTGDAPSVDAALKPLEKKLRKPPFSSWNTFKQLGSQSIALDSMKAGAVTLVHGKASLLLRDVSGEGKRVRLSLQISLDDGAGKRVLDSKVNVDAREYFVVGRSLPENRGHLVALTCRR